MAQRTIAVPLALSSPQSEIKVKLHSGYRFWDLNQVRIAYNTETPALEYMLYPQMVDVPDRIVHKLEKIDNYYLVQDNTGDFTEILWEVPDLQKNKDYSVFLECTGYYITNSNNRGRPDISQLEKFREPGYFSIYSYSKYDEDVLLPLTVVEAGAQ
jgi:hypothetical protein